MSRSQIARSFGVRETLLRQLESRGVLPPWGSLCPSGYVAAVRLYLGARSAGATARGMTEAMKALNEGDETMPRVELPMTAGSLAQGLGYREHPVPSDDAAIIKPSDSETRIPGTRNAKVGTGPSLDKPVEVVSIATKTELLNPLGARKRNNLHKDRWLDYTKPHVGNEDS